MKKLSCLFLSLLPILALSAAPKPDPSAKQVYPHVFAPSEGLFNSYEQATRNEICLNGLWDFQAVPLPADYKQGKGIAPVLPEPSAEAWSDVRIKIPSPWDVNAFGKRTDGPDYRSYPSYPEAWKTVKMAWMRKKVMVPSDWDGECIRLHFEAVAGYAEVYVDGEKVGENFDLFLPFDLDITDKVRPGKEIEILVGVRSQQLFEDNSTVGRRIIPAGSMWGRLNGIWQDVYLYSMPQINIKDVYVKPLVSQGILQFQVEVENNTSKNAKVSLDACVREWINKAGKSIEEAPVPQWELGQTVLSVSPVKLSVPAHECLKTVLEIPVRNELKFWTPEFPNLYASLLTLSAGKKQLDCEYERFGWREWTISGSRHCLNGTPYQLKGDSWHFLGIPQMTRRYAWAWFTAIKGMNGNAVRPHAQVYPRFYLDMADEMGICVLDETANWASDGGPKLDSELFWENSKTHLRGLVLRDRNHASVFGWSISNENKPVILNVYKRKDLLPLQVEAWEEWRDIVREFDPTRPWISSDGEEDGMGILPVTVGHYGGDDAFRAWMALGKPWGVGEQSKAYFGTPAQVAAENGERAYESQEGRMEGLAVEAYRLLSTQARSGASYATVFNMAWYALKPLPLGLRDDTKAPDITKDGIFFSTYVEGQPGVQPERLGPYCSTFNPGYDPSLPLFDPWPMYDAMRAANAPDSPAWSPYADFDKTRYDAPAASCTDFYEQVRFLGDVQSRTAEDFRNMGLVIDQNLNVGNRSLIIADASLDLDADNCVSLQKCLAKGADLWIYDIRPSTLDSWQKILPAHLELQELHRSSFIPVQKSWMRGLNNSDFYFCEIQKNDVSSYTLAGSLADEGQVLLNACKTDWKKWNYQPEILKTAMTYRSERECTSSRVVFLKVHVGKSDIYISTLSDFMNSEYGYHLMDKIFAHAGIPRDGKVSEVAELMFMRNGKLMLPESFSKKFQKQGMSSVAEFYVYSPRDLENLLIEPDMPAVRFNINKDAATMVFELNGTSLEISTSSRNDSYIDNLPLRKGWNKVVLKLSSDCKNVLADFDSNQKEYLEQLKFTYKSME